MGNLLAVKLGLDASFAKDKDGFLVGGQLQDAGDVDGSAVGRAKDFILFVFHLSHGKEHATLKRETYNSSRNTHARELLLVVGARLGAVVGDKDDLLAFVRVNGNSSRVRPIEADGTFAAQ